ncbi:MAG: nucleotide sugar dehydrogenase [Acidimicrobiia bacterium]
MSRNVAKRFDLAVIGLGYVGLPLVIEATRSGLTVLGIEVDSRKVQSLLEGISYVEGVSNDDLLGALAGGFLPTVDSSQLAHAEAAVICVPTPLKDQAPDLTAVIDAGVAVGKHLERGQLVVLQSTSYPGTTEDVLQPVLEQHSGLKAGPDFFLAFAPERIDPGNADWNLRNTPKLVAGIDGPSTERAAELFGKFCDEIVILPGPREAEMAKLLENTYRHVNIALMNEMAIFCRELGIDIWEVIRGASTKPFGFQAFYPGPGVGGHCIPVDPNYLSFRVGQLGYPFRFVELAKEINARMPTYVVSRIVELLNNHDRPVKNSRVVLLGVAYKPDVGDIRETPALPIARKLLDLGAELCFADPYVAEFSVDGRHVEKIPHTDVLTTEADIFVVITAHSALDLMELADNGRLILDTRGVMPAGTAAGL